MSEEILKVNFLKANSWEMMWHIGHNTKGGEIKYAYLPHY